MMQTAGSAQNKKVRLQFTKMQKDSSGVFEVMNDGNFRCQHLIILKDSNLKHTDSDTEMKRRLDMLATACVNFGVNTVH